MDVIKFYLQPSIFYQFGAIPPKNKRPTECSRM